MTYFKVFLSANILMLITCRAEVFSFSLKRGLKILSELALTFPLPKMFVGAAYLNSYRNLKIEVQRK